MLMLKGFFLGGGGQLTYVSTSRCQPHASVAGWENNNGQDRDSNPGLLNL